jgi:tetrapyrrole methylase family protein/MazG family protein
MNQLPHISSIPTDENAWFSALIALARYLRTPDGCPWDREQNSEKFAGYLKGEMDELIEALEENDGPHIEEEAGDVLFTFLAVVAAAEEEGHLTLEVVMEKAHEKMIRRHEHVFGEVKAETAEDAVEAWEEAKRKERESKSDS